MHGSRLVGFRKDHGEFLATEPAGGFLVWVESPEGYDGNRLCDDALERGITITPGSLFSPSGRHANHIRLSACHHFSDRNVHALLTLGELARGQLGKWT